MKIGFIIICRYNSSRLPGKILKPINGKPIIAYIIERLEKVVPRNQIIVATSEEQTDDPINDYCIRNNVNCFRGSLNNVSGRFLKCAEKNELDYAVRINGDNFFIDIDTVKKMIEVANTNKYDVVSNLKNRSYPKGMSVEMVKTKFYKSQYQLFKSPDDFEHVTIFLYQNEKNGKFYYEYNTIAPEAAGIQLAIDNIEDFNLVKSIIDKFEKEHYQYGLKEVFSIYESIKK